jgi:hypothetical protein
MQRALEAARALLDATEALGRAIHDADFETLGEAIEAREESFRAVTELVDEAPSGELRTLLLRVSALDRKLLAAALAARDEVRQQLEALSAARRAARALRPPKAAPRFIERRV